MNVLLDILEDTRIPGFENCKDTINMDTCLINTYLIKFTPLIKIVISPAAKRVSTKYFSNSITKIPYHPLILIILQSITKMSSGVS